MKVVHVLKKIETIDNDIKELRKMEKSLLRNKSFTTPIYLSIEKQINILLGERIKMLELRIQNPPPGMVDPVDEPSVAEKTTPPKSAAKKPAGGGGKKKSKPVKKAQAQAIKELEDIPMMTQDLIDRKVEDIKNEPAVHTPKNILDEDEPDILNDDSVKLLDIALEKGSISKGDVDREKKKIKFFKENFPGGEY